MSNKHHVDVEAAGLRQDYAKTLKEIEAKGVCPFCPEHIDHHGKKILWDGNLWLMRENAFSYAGTKHHFLILHKPHIEHLSDITPEAWMEFHDALKWLCKEYEIPGGSFFMRFGEMDYTGASVRHLHAQMIVGTSKQEGKFPIAPWLGFSPVEYVPPKK